MQTASSSIGSPSQNRYRGMLWRGAGVAATLGKEILPHPVQQAGGWLQQGQLAGHDPVARHIHNPSGTGRARTTQRHSATNQVAQQHTGTGRYLRPEFTQTKPPFLWRQSFPGSEVADQALVSLMNPAKSRCGRHHFSGRIDIRPFPIWPWRSIMPKKMNPPR